MEEAEINKWISAVEQRGKSNSHRLDALEKQTEALNTLATSVAVMAERVEVTGVKVVRPGCAQSADGGQLHPGPSGYRGC